MIKLGVIGVGTFGINHLRAFKQLSYEGKVSLVAVADLNEKRLGELEKEFRFKAYTDYKKMLEKEELDGVSIATPDFLHKEIALNAISSGRHVLVEKPLDVTVEGCREIVQRAQQKGVLLEVDFHKRFDPYHMELERLVSEEKKLGEVLYGYVHMEDRIEVPRDWFPGWAPKSSPVWFLGVHFYDLMRWVMKSNGRSVYARSQRKKLKSLGIDSDDSVQAQVEFDNGAVVSFDTSWILPDKFEAVVNQGLRLVGTEGMVEIDSQDRGAVACYSNDGGMITYNLGFRYKKKDRYGRQIYLGYGIESIQDFAENLAYLKDGGKLKDLEGKYPSGLDGLEVTKIACAIEESARSGRVVKI